MTVSENFQVLVNQCREHCLWFISTDRLPSTRATQLEVLRLIERYGTRDDFIRSKRLRTWLLQNSKETFSVS